MSSRIKFTVVISSAFLAVVLLLGTVLGKSATQPDSTYRHLSVFTEVLSRIKSEYVEEPDMKSVTLGALNGLLESIDPFASYLNVDQYKDYVKNKDAKRADVGLVLSKKFGFVGVVGVIPGSPASKAGFSTGDMLESIKGVATRDMPLAYANLLLQGDAGSTVDVEVVRVRRPEPQKLTLTRAHITYQPIEAKIIQQGSVKVGYLNVDIMDHGKVTEIASAIKSLEKDGAQRFILDLRNCSFGAADDGLALANLFMQKGPLGYLQGQRQPRQDFAADPAKAVTTLPLVVITNRGTAEAAEIAAAALIDSKRADSVGERSYGDASLRRAITMEDGGAIILSVAKYYSPNGKAIQDTGVMPANVLSEPEPQVDFDENGEPLPEKEEQVQQRQQEDPLMKKALELSGK